MLKMIYGKRMVPFGPQFKYGTDEPVYGVEEFTGQQLVYVNSIRRESQGDFTSEGGMDQGEENSGARFNKYKSGTVNDPNYWENHYILYRLTEIYFFKAEALMRKMEVRHLRKPLISSMLPANVLLLRKIGKQTSTQPLH